MIRSFLFEDKGVYDQKMFDIEEMIRSATGGERPDFCRAVHEAVENAFKFGKYGDQTEVSLNIYEGLHFMKATVSSDSIAFDCAAYRNRMQARALAHDGSWMKLIDRQMPGRGFWRMLENSDFITFGKDGTVHLYLKRPYQKRVTKRAQSLIIRFFVKDEAGNIV